MPRITDLSRNVWDSFWDFIFPPSCPLCGKYVAQKGGWCEECLQKTLAVRKLALPPDSPFAEVWALGNYRESLGKQIKNLKYRRRMSTLPYLDFFLEAAGKELPVMWEKDWLAVPVPLYAAKEKGRGFNQTELIFKEWLKSKGISLARALVRNRETKAMYGLSPGERQENLRGAFEAVLVEGRSLVQGRKVLLLDDIYTTGSTLEACGRVLKAAGAVKVIGLVLASDH